MGVGESYVDRWVGRCERERENVCMCMCVYACKFVLYYIVLYYAILYIALKSV